MFSASALLLVLQFAFAASAWAAQPKVVATIFPLASWLAELTEDTAEVEQLLPAGANPHMFEPPPAQVRALSQAILLVTVGAGLDDWAGKIAVAAGGNLHVLRLADRVPLLPLTGEQGRDPHFWLDPILVRDHVMPALTDALARVAPQHAGAHAARARQWSEELSRLDERLRQELAPVRGRAYIAVHSAWRYFAHRYGLVEAATVEPVPGRELSAKEMIALVEQVRRSGARALIVEPYVFSKVASQIAAETGIRLVTVDPFGGGALHGGYIRLMEANARAFVEALR
ncbi:MAG: metal ABC transporter substrate-binding protein [Candidatus Binatia bacterium]|nr:metal ABC transporter substrate-binding protein [Candidatus Binatia bacterium]